jgi:membrane-associated protease RseP (regulator of RpoE activity)
VTIRALFAAAALLAAASVGCGAIYPELATRLETVPEGREVDPPPPEGLRWIEFESGEVPPTTRDGRPWGRGLQEGLPDPVARLFVNDVELIKTDAAPKTLTPKFTGKAGNFPIAIGDQLRVELWDSDPLNDRAIGVGKGRVTHEMLADGRWTASFDMGGRVTLLIKPARPMWGLGIWYELRQGGASITRLLDNSPAARAGLKKGDEIVGIGPTEVRLMTPDEIRSAMNAPPAAGLQLTVRHADGATLQAKVKPGPVYAPYSQYQDTR